MKKMRTQAMLQEFLDTQTAWRKKEIADLKAAVRATEHTSRRSLIRAGIPLLYAHWEGFVKTASEALLNYIYHRKLNYRQLRPCYIVLGAKRHLNNLASSGNILENVAAVEFFLNGLDARAELQFEGSINTQANLSSAVFERIARSIGIDTSRYETKYKFIDSSLLQRRNQIAHGEYLDVDHNQFDELADMVINLINEYRIDIENIVTTNAHLAQTPQSNMN
jgi:hypothetical protein